MSLIIGLITFILFYIEGVNSQNTRNAALKYAILNKTQYVNKIDLTNSGFSLYYGLGQSPNQNKVYFYFVRTPTGGAPVDLEIIFGSSLQSVYSMTLSRYTTATPSFECGTLDQFYTNGVPAAVASTTVKDNCALSNLNEWNENILYYRELAPANGYKIELGKPMNIQFIIKGGTPSTFTYTITLFGSRYCHGVCGDTNCDGPEQDDCTSCKDPLRVALHNRCVQKEPQPLPQVSGTPQPDQIWNKIEFMNNNFNSSLYYGFRTEQGLDYCYFRIIVNQAMTADPLITPSWIGFSFTDTHKTAATPPYSDMLIIRYAAAYTPNSPPIVEDYHTESTINPPNTATPGSYPIKDTIQNYVVTQGGYDGSSKWDVTIMRMCNLQDLTLLGPAMASYYDSTSDLIKVVSCHQNNVCTYGAGVTNYAFSLVLGKKRWDNANIMNNIHYDKIKDVTYPTPASSKLVNQKYCASCRNTYSDCVGPERQDCTVCNTPSEEFDPLYPSGGPGICIPKIPPCHEDCVSKQCITSFNDGCKVCSDPTKFLYLPPAGRCITSKTLFWNKVDLGTTDLSFYYGWDSSFEFIYFRFVGTIKGWVGLLFYKDKSSFSTQQDTFYVANNPPLQAVDSKCSNPVDCFKPASTPDVIQNVVVLPQTSWTATSLDMIVSRQADTKDNQDVLIDNNYIGVTIFYDTIQTNVAASFSGSTLKTVEKPIQKFLKTQQCAQNCSSCSGPENNDCLTCNTGFALAGSAPSSCVGIQTTGCSNAACKTCQQGSTNLCITCVSIIQVVYNGVCISKYPTSWNKIQFQQANFTLYYGFDAAKTNIYFRVTGKNNGWIGFGFMDRTLSTSKHLNTDMFVLRKDSTNTNLLLEDRLSLSQSEPVLDTNVKGKNNLQYIQGDRDIEGYWDVYFVRACNTGDTIAKDFVIQPNMYFYLSFAYGPSDILTGHQQVFQLTTIFKDSQICHETCATCTGPEMHQCTGCQAGFALQGSSPSYCVLEQKTCSQSCLTCTGPTVSDCITCANASYMQAGGLCTPNSPSFWNKVEISPSGLLLYYGYDTALENIYFRLKGSGAQGWLGMAFQTVKEKMDMIVMRMVSGNTILEDRYTEYHNYLPYDDINLGGKTNYYLVSGGRTNINDWDVTFMRKVSQIDTSFDTIIDQRLYTLSIAYGASDLFDKHSSLYSVPNIRFLTKQVCDQKCLTCLGPEPTDCQTCPSGQKLAGTAPSSCVDPGVTCHINCATCSGPGQSDCLKCSAVDKISYNGSCINSSPSLWNKIEVKKDFVLYYGYDAGGSYIYFRAVGTASGWFGVGFNDSMINTDMHIVRIPTTVVEVEDRYSLGHVLPLLDLQNNLVLIKGSLIGTQLDCTWVRSTISSDTTYDVSLGFDITRNMVFAFGSTQVFNKHTEVYIKKDITLVRSQVCTSGCLKCTGPEVADCTQFDSTTTTVTDNKNTVDWSYSIINKSIYILLLAVIIAFV